MIVETFKHGQPVVGTSYFYWYDVYSGAHIRNADGTDALTTHPPAAAMADFSYKSADWHYAQLRDIREAGIDFILPVYWGVPGHQSHWSVVGLPPLVAACDRMLAESRTHPDGPVPPAIGMFFDTSTLRWNRPHGSSTVAGEPIDVTTDAGKRWFYTCIRDFFSMIPPGKWARVDGDPIVFVYAAEFAKAKDASLWAYVQERFRTDFATGLFIAREASWPGRTEAWYRWGGAHGLLVGDNIAALGPGYDHSAVPGRAPLVVSRQNGAFYVQQWEKLLQMNPLRRPWMVHIETWNEYHEGSDVARSQEYGDRYIRMTAQYAEMFRAGLQLDPRGAFAHADAVRFSGRQSEGLELLAGQLDGPWRRTIVEGSPAVVSVPNPPDKHVTYVYFDVDNSYMFDEIDRSVEVTVVFRDDGGCGSFFIEYDNADAAAGPADGAFRAMPPIEVGTSGTWRTIKTILPQARFVDRTHGGDLRLAVLGKQRALTVREVIVRKLPGVEMKLPQ